MEIAKLIGNFTPGAYGIWTLVVMFALALLREWRETRKLSSSDRLARREGYAAQVSALMGENRQQRADMVTLRKEYDDYRALCHAETDALRTIVVRLEGEVSGYKRKADTLAIEVGKLKGVSSPRPKGGAR